MMDRIISARTQLLNAQPFFGALAMWLKLREDPTCETGWTDGVTLAFNPVFLAGLTSEQAKAFVAHKVMHCAQGHMWRRDGREMGRWNISCDKTINSTLRECGFSTGKDWYYAEGPEVGQSAEWIYARLPEQPPSGGGIGEVRDSPKSQEGQEDQAPTEAEWKQRTKQAAQVAKMMGKLPSTLERFADKVGKSRVDWRSVLRRFVSERAKADYTWSRPNTRYLSLGLYLPALESHAMGEIAIAVDTSGSIDDIALGMAKAEVLAVVNEMQPSGLVIYYADARVASADRFERGEEVIWRPKGGGGTDFRPVFKACEESAIPPVCLLYITDLAGTFPSESTIPTLWITDTDSIAPIGETVRLS